MPEKIARTLHKWIKAQANELYSFELPRRGHRTQSYASSTYAKDGDVMDAEPPGADLAESRESHAYAGADDETPAVPWGRKKGGKTPPLLAHASASAAHPNGHEMDREEEAYSGGRASSKVRNFDGDDICGRDSLEFAIPTPTSGSDFQGSPEISIRASGDFYQQGQGGVAVGGSDGR